MNILKLSYTSWGNFPEHDIYIFISCGKFPNIYLNYLSPVGYSPKISWGISPPVFADPFFVSPHTAIGGKFRDIQWKEKVLSNFFYTILVILTCIYAEIRGGGAQKGLGEIPQNIWGNSPRLIYNSDWFWGISPQDINNSDWYWGISPQDINIWNIWKN